MEESHRKVLKKWRLKISRNINVRKITEELFSEGILDENDREEIRSQTAIEYKALHLLDLLPRRGSQAFPKFMRALRQSGSGFDLANVIQAELSGTGLENFLILYISTPADQVRDRVLNTFANT